MNELDPFKSGTIHLADNIYFVYLKNIFRLKSLKYDFFFNFLKNATPITYKNSIYIKVKC